MNAKRMVFGSILLALLLVTLSAPYAFGCSPDDMDERKCNPVPRVKATPVPTRAVVAVAAPKPVRLGVSPETAMDPPGTWQSIGPGAKLWFQINDSGRQLEVWVSANGQQGLAMAIYAPDQHDLYGPPVGRGTRNQSMPGRDLFWSGRTNARGTWFAVITNHSDIPISFQIGYQRLIHSVADRCSECHGYEIEWDRCESQGDNFCGDLQDEYAQENK